MTDNFPGYWAETAVKSACLRHAMIWQTLSRETREIRFMKKLTTLNRRQFVGAMAAGSAPILLGSSTFAANNGQTSQQPICCFAKPLQHLSMDALADRVAEMGFQGIEATIRKGGQIEPAQVKEELPKLVEALRKRNLEITVMASDINDADHADTEPVLRTAAELGIQRYRMKYFHYDLKRPIAQQLEEIKPRLKALAALNRELEITAVYQNHAGNGLVGAMVWDLHELLQDISPQEIGIAYDIRHATVEGGLSWPVGFHLVRPHIDVVYVKDFQWKEGKPRNVPLGEGMVDPKFFAMLQQSDFHGPFSLHMEYIDHRDPQLGEARLAAIARDIRVLRRWLDEAA